MSYKKWNKNKLIEQLKYATKCYYENPTQEMAITMATIEDLLNNHPRLFAPEIRFDDQVEADKTIVKDNLEFIQHIQEFADLDEAFNVKRIPPLNELDVKDKTLLSFVHDFYNSLDREFARHFNKVFKERHNNLRMTSNNQEGYNRNYMTWIYTLNYAYININRTDTIEDFTNLVHEYAHTIADQMRYRPRYGKYPFIELLPLLMEEIAYDEIIRCFDGLELEVFKADAYETKTVLKYAYEIALQEDYLTTENPTLERKQFINSMAQFTNNTKAKTEKILNITLQEKISYVIPFLVMIELYDMHYKDRDKCMYVLKNLITMDETNNYIQYLESLGVHINRHAEEYVEEQKKILRLTDLM